MLPSRWARTLIAAAAAAVFASVLAPEASAQGFLDRLFGPRTPPPPAANSQPPPGQYYRFDPYSTYPPNYLSPPSPNDRPQSRGPSEPPLPKIAVVPKDPDAAQILVIGDFLASQLAEGLTFTLGDDPKFVVVDRSNSASGLVRNDFYDWEKTLPDLLNKVKPAYVVFMIGANDRQALRTGPTTREAVRSDVWEAAYRKRIDGVLQTAKAYGRPFYWVGLPPMASASSAADMAYFNGFFKLGVEGVGGTFLDVWNGFADETGKFAMRAPDADGQVRTMRQGDGVNLTRAGEIKLAYYVDHEIRKNGGPAAQTLTTSSSSGERIEVGPHGERWLVGPVISLTDPPPGTGGKLAGGGPAATPAEGSAQYRMVVEGSALPPVGGRADDISWPPMKAELVTPVLVSTTGAASTGGVTITAPLSAPAAPANRVVNSGQGTGAATTNQGAPATTGQGTRAANTQTPPPPPNTGRQVIVGPIPPAPIPSGR